MARLTGSTLRTVRFYEEAGLLAPRARADGGHRSFDEKELLKLQLILDLRESGLSLQHIRELFDLKNSCDTAKQASLKMTAILEHQIADMQQKIEMLQGLRRELTSTLSVLGRCQGCDSPGFPLRCRGCAELAQPEVPRAARLLWG